MYESCMIHLEREHFVFDQISFMHIKEFKFSTIPASSNWVILLLVIFSYISQLYCIVTWRKRWLLMTCSKNVSLFSNSLFLFVLYFCMRMWETHFHFYLTSTKPSKNTIERMVRLIDGLIRSSFRLLSILK